MGLLHMRPLQQWFARHRVSPLEDGRRLLPLRARLPGSRGMVAYDSGPSGGWSYESSMFQSHNIYRRLYEGLGHSVPGLFSPGSVETLLERGSCEPIRVGGSASGVGVLPAGVPGEAGPHRDNSTVVSYINRQGGMRSRALHNGARRLLLWPHAHGVSLRAVYLPGKDNVAADLLSRGGPLPGEWWLHRVIVQAIWGCFGRAQVDLFASWETTHSPWWYSMIGPKGTLGVDVLAYTWPRALLYAFPSSLFCQQCWPE